MIKEFVNYEMALALKELGFDEPCLDCYNIYGKRWEMRLNKQSTIEGACLAPTFSQAFRFFREKYKMAIINPDWNNKFKYEIFNLHLLNQGVLFTKSGFENYEEAELACLQKMIETIKNK